MSKGHTDGPKIKSFAQVSRNIALIYAPEQTPGHRLKSLMISGEHVQDTKTYVISTIDFVAGGGSAFIYPIQKAGPPGENLEVVVAKYFDKKDGFAPELERRPRIVKFKEPDVKLYNDGKGKQVIVGDKSCFGASCFMED